MRLLAGALALCAAFQGAQAQCADLDASGMIGVEDLLAVLSDYGRCVARAHTHCFSPPIPMTFTLTITFSGSSLPAPGAEPQAPILPAMAV